jgi:hypothetical protein
MNVEDLENMKGVKLPKVSQIGIVVPDIGKAVRYYSKVLHFLLFDSEKIHKVRVE